ncbi:HNH endonuclease [Caproiciproducens sp.]
MTDEEKRKQACKDQLEYLIAKKKIIKSNPHVCHYCKRNLSKNEITIDHLVPLSRGGASVESNLVICCPECNHEKNDMTEQEYIAFKNKSAIIPKRHYHYDELLNLQEIKIPMSYARSCVKKNKLQKVSSYYNRHGELDEPIMVKSHADKLLLDGYVRFVVAKNQMVSTVPVVYVYD